MATDNDNGPQGIDASEAQESSVMPLVFETGADGEEIFDPEGAEDEAFDRANDAVKPQRECVNRDPRANRVAAFEHISKAADKLSTVYSASVVLRLALKGQSADQDYEIANILNRHVTREVGRVIYRLVRAAQRLGADIPNPMEP